MPRSGRLAHPALLYADAGEFVEGMVPFLRAGIENDETVFVAARADYLDAVRDELGADAVAARWADTRIWHPHHASRLRAFYELISGSPEGTRFRLVGEPIWPEHPEHVREWQRYESALNAILAPFAVSLLCLYDASALEPSVLETARRTHPWVEIGRIGSASDTFEEPGAFLRRWSAEPTAPPVPAEVVDRNDDLARARGHILDRAIAAGVDPGTAVALSIAANEVLTNALVHGGGEARLSIWAEDGRFICQVEDAGVGIEDPIAGYRPPGGGIGGRGLWLARQLVDLMEILPSERGATIRLHAPVA